MPTGGRAETGTGFTTGLEVEAELGSELATPDGGEGGVGGGVPGVGCTRANGIVSVPSPSSRTPSATANVSGCETN